MIISPFTPLFFPEIKVDGIDSRYIQTFATSDEILVEVIGLASEGTPTASIICEPSQDVLCNIQFSQWDINANDRLFFATLNLSPGLYCLVPDRLYMGAVNGAVKRDSAVLDCCGSAVRLTAKTIGGVRGCVSKAAELLAEINGEENKIDIAQEACRKICGECRNSEICCSGSSRRACRVQERHWDRNRMAQRAFLQFGRYGSMWFVQGRKRRKRPIAEVTHIFYYIYMTSGTYEKEN